MELNKDLIEESNAYKAATIIAGKKVHVIGRIGRARLRGDEHSYEGSHTGGHDGEPRLGPGRQRK